MKKSNVVLAGDKIYCSVDHPDDGNDPATEIKWCLVLEFPDQESYAAAMKAGRSDFTVFNQPGNEVDNHER